jgi:hypothetical protein
MMTGDSAPPPPVDRSIAGPLAFKYLCLPRVIGNLAPAEVGRIFSSARDPMTFLPQRGVHFAEFCVGYCYNLPNKRSVPLVATSSLRFAHGCVVGSTQAFAQACAVVAPADEQDAEEEEDEFEDDALPSALPSAPPSPLPLVQRTKRSGGATSAFACTRLPRALPAPAVADPDATTIHSAPIVTAVAKRRPRARKSIRASTSTRTSNTRTSTEGDGDTGIQLSLFNFELGAAQDPSVSSDAPCLGLSSKLKRRRVERSSPEVEVEIEVESHDVRAHDED